MHIYCLVIKKSCYVYASDESEAKTIAQAQMDFAKTAFEIDGPPIDEDEPFLIDGDLAEEIPVSRSGSNPFGFSIKQLDKMLRKYPGVGESLLEPTDFPIVPELEPSAEEFFNILDDITEEPQNADWKMKNYLFLRFPKLRDVLLLRHKQKHAG